MNSTFEIKAHFLTSMSGRDRTPDTTEDSRRESEDRSDAKLDRSLGSVASNAPEQE